VRRVPGGRERPHRVWRCMEGWGAGVRGPGVQGGAACKPSPGAFALPLLPAASLAGDARNCAGKIPGSLLLPLATVLCCRHVGCPALRLLRTGRSARRRRRRRRRRDGLQPGGVLGRGVPRRTAAAVSETPPVLPAGARLAGGEPGLGDGASASPSRRPQGGCHWGGARSPAGGLWRVPSWGTQVGEGTLLSTCAPSLPAPHLGHLASSWRGSGG